MWKPRQWQVISFVILESDLTKWIIWKGLTLLPNKYYLTNFIVVVKLASYKYVVLPFLFLDIKDNLSVINEIIQTWKLLTQLDD